MNILEVNLAREYFNSTYDNYKTVLDEERIQVWREMIKFNNFLMGKGPNPFLQLNTREVNQ